MPESGVAGRGAEVRRLEEDNAILGPATVSSLGNSAPQPLILAFIDAMRIDGHAVETTCRVLREQGCRVVRTYRVCGVAIHRRPPGPCPTRCWWVPSWPPIAPGRALSHP
jgi:hypothetical protein